MILPLAALAEPPGAAPTQAHQVPIQVPTRPPAPVAQSAQTAGPPKALLVPTGYLQRLVLLLSDQKEAEQIPLYQADFKPLIDAIVACLNIQIPNAQGVTVSHGECPEVTQAMAAPPPGQKTAP